MTLVRSVFLCVTATLVVYLGICAHFTIAAWSDQLYFNGDNITLALVVKSISEGQPFRWVFSSQTFLFPEGPIYYFAYLLAGDLKSSLLATSFINCVLLVVPILLLGNRIYPRNNSGLESLALFFALFSTNLVLESTPDINGSTILTPVLFATYYSGAVIVALYSLLILPNALSGSFVQRVLSGFILVLLGGLTYASDPLYLLQVLLPLAFGSIVLAITEPSFTKYSKRVVLLTIASLLTGLAIRYWTSPYAVATVGSYINLSKIVDAFSGLFTIIRGSTSEPFHALLWAFWSLLFLAHGFYTLRLLKRAESTSISLLNVRFLHLFLFLSPVITVSGVLFTGNYFTRYLLPLPVFTLVGFSLMLPGLINSRLVSVLTLTILAFCGLYFSMNNNAVERGITTNESDVQCFTKVAKENDLHAVGSYWTSRYLTLYAPAEHQVYQVLNDFKPFNWLSNRLDHSKTSINSVIVDRESKPLMITVNDTKTLGKPDLVHACQQFDIYVYKPGSSGHELLNVLIRQ